jgi:hypothetical protein
MWISKAQLAALEVRNQWLEQQNTTLDKQLGEARLQIVALERALATSQTNVDWMRTMVNNAIADRNALARTKGIELDDYEIAGRLQTPADVEARALAAARAREAAGGANVDPAIVGQRLSDADSVEGAMAIMQGAVGGFEDVGDEEAERLGIRHNEHDGQVEYAK